MVHHGKVQRGVASRTDCLPVAHWRPRHIPRLKVREPPAPVVVRCWLGEAREIKAPEVARDLRPIRLLPVRFLRTIRARRLAQVIKQGPNP